MAERKHRGEGSASDEPHEAYAEAQRRLWPSVSRAEIGEDTPIARRLAGVADAAAVQDEPEAEGATLDRRHEFVQVELHLHRVVVRGETESLRETTNMRVDGESG